MVLTSAQILSLIFLATDLMVIAPVQWAKLKRMASDGSLTDGQVNALLVASETTSDNLIAVIDNL